MKWFQKEGYFVFGVILFILGSTEWSWGEQYTEYKLVPPPSEEVAFGKSVAISGSVCIVGAPMESVYRGTVYIFGFNGTNWEQQAKLQASDGAAWNRFGYSVGIDGEYCVVGAYANENTDGTQGSAYIFHYNGSTWQEQQKLTGFGDGLTQLFGYAVSIHGSVCAIGAFGEDSSGSVFIFRRSGTSWIGEQKLKASDMDSSDQLGNSVCVYGDYCIAGAPNDEAAGAPASGSAFIFKYNGSTWQQQAKLMAPAPVGYWDWYGGSVAIYEDVCVVGSPGDDDVGSGSGSAYVYRQNGGLWVSEQKLTAADGAPNDSFGGSVSIRENRILIGASGDDDRGNSSGSAYVFSCNETIWSQTSKLLSSDGEAYDYFGESVGLDGEHLIIGADMENKDGCSGASYVYHAQSAGDVTGDGKVNGEDLEMMTAKWLFTENCQADIAPSGGDGLVNLRDFAVMSQNWLNGTK